MPLLIIFNLFFGWLFLKPIYWLFLELLLILIFIITGYIATRKIISGSYRRRNRNVVDVEGKVLKDKE